MAAISNFLENAIIDHWLRNSAAASPATVYIALFVDDPTDADTGTEVAGGSYARTSATFDAPSDGVTQNSAAITFPSATADWGVVTHLGIYDASVGGNLLFHGMLSIGQNVLNGQTFSLSAGALIVEIT